MTTLTLQNCAELELTYGSVYNDEIEEMIYLTKLPALYIPRGMYPQYTPFEQDASFEKPCFQCEGVDSEGVKYYVDFAIADYITPDFSEFRIEKM